MHIRQLRGWLMRLFGLFDRGRREREFAEELESHLEECSECKLVVNQTKKTIELFCDSEPVELPKEVRNRLHDALQKKLGKSA